VDIILENHHVFHVSRLAKHLVFNIMKL